MQEIKNEIKINELESVNNARDKEIEYLAINDLTPYKKNARTHDEYQIEKLKNSLKEFGFINPVIIDENNMILVGHGRIMGAKELGIETVPCIRIKYLTDDQKKAYILADNKLSDLGGWDLDLLNEELLSIDLDMSMFGFDDIDISIELEESEIIEDEIPEVPEEPKAKLGDIYQLGNHRLMCGDSTSIDDVEKLMNGVKADMVFTDPPYGINYSGGRTQVVETKEYGKLKNDNLKGIELGNLICNVFLFNKQESDIYICVSPIMQKPFLDYIEHQNKKINAVIVWDKKQPGLGYMAYRRQCEFILFIKGKEFKKGDISDFDLWSISRDNAITYVHGTQKPVGVSARAINNSSKQEDTVLDLFGGSGSTLIACEQLNRKCYMMELDPHYIDVIIQRWENFTGKKAVKINGEL